MLQIIGIAIAGLIAAVLGLAAKKPSAFTLKRSARINTPPERILPHIVDFRKWLAWSPWEKLDPALKRTHSGAPSGKGAVYEWEGNPKAGKGRMEITDATANRVGITIQFIKPFEATNSVEFLLTPSGTGTDVTWSMSGDHAFMMKVMDIFVSLDKMVGKDFEQGLANLKAVAEAQ